MMPPKQITPKEVQHIAKLARIRLTDAEIEMFTKQLGAVLNYIGKLKEVDTTAVLPLFNPTNLSDVVRSDNKSFQPSLSQGHALQNAPEKEKGLFKVKTVF